MQTEDDDEDEVDNTPKNERVLAFAFTQGKYWIYNGKEDKKELTWNSLKNRAWLVVNQVEETRQNMMLENHRYKL